MRIKVKVTERDAKKGAPFIDSNLTDGDDALVLAIKRAIKRAGIKRKLKIESWWGGEISINGRSQWPSNLRDMPDFYEGDFLTKAHIKWISTPRIFFINLEGD